MQTVKYAKTEKIILALIILPLIFLVAAKDGSCSKKKKVKVGTSVYPEFRLNPPSNLYGVSVSSSRIDLYWQDNSYNEDGFEIERSSNAITYTLLGSVPTNETVYSNTGLSPVTTYYYRVRSFNTVGDRSDWSNTISAGTLNVAWSPIAAGLCHTVYLATDGVLWGFGRNDWFQLGQGIEDTSERPMPIRIVTDTDWSLLSAGGWSSAAIKTDGTLWAWGNNQNGQLGFGDTDYDGDLPYQESRFDTDWSNIAMGGLSTVALKTGGTIWGCGYNGYGEVGAGNVGETIMDFTQIGADSDWNMIACGAAHAIARKNNGTIWGWGYNYHGQIGLGYTSGQPPSVTPGVTSPTKIGVAADWFAIAAGYSHTLAIKNNRTLWVWGLNNAGQLGLGYWGDQRLVPVQLGNASDWSIVAGGKDLLLSYSVGLKTNKTLWSWGNNTAGQLGFGDNTARYAPEQVGTDSNWLTAIASRAFTVALKTDSTIWAWGQNTYGQLGVIDRFDRNSPSQTGIIPEINPPSALTAAVGSSSEIDLYWADLSDNETGFQIERKTGRAGTWAEVTTVSANQNSWADATVLTSTVYYYRILAYTAVSDSAYSNEAYNMTSGDWSSVSAGWRHTIAMKTNSTIWSWGYNYFGELGLGDNSDRNIPIQVGSDSDWSKIEAGGYNSFAIKTDSTLWGWGYNYNYELGLGDAVIRNVPTQINSDSDWCFMSAGGADGNSGYAFALKSSGTLWAWGSNGASQLGLGDNTTRFVPTQVSTDSDWSKILAGYSHSLALKTNGTIFSWGANSYGELGIGGAGARNSPTQVGVDSDWFLVAAGNFFSVARKTDGTIWSWGTNISGQLGLGDNIDRNIPTQVGTDSDWSVINTGGVFPALIDHTVAIKTDGSIWGWGDNGYWQLGLGDFVRLRQFPSLIDVNTDWVSVSGGGLNTFWLKANPPGGGAGGTIWGCGYNDFGQLGLGDNGNSVSRRNLTLVGD